MKRKRRPRLVAKFKTGRFHVTVEDHSECYDPEHPWYEGPALRSV